MVKLVSSDQQTIVVDRRIVQMSEVLLGAIGHEDDDEDDQGDTLEVPCLQVHSDELKRIVEYCEHYDFHRAIDRIPLPIPEGDMSQWADKWECDFIKRLSLEELSKLLAASNYLYVPALFELCCASVASIFKNKQFNKLKKELGAGLADKLHHLELPRYTAAQDAELMQ